MHAGRQPPSALLTAAQRRQWAFAIYQQDRLAARVWGDERVEGERRVIATWLWARGPGSAPPARVFSELATDASLRPKRYDVTDATGRRLMLLRFGDGMVHVTLHDGTELEVPAAGVRYLLASNALPQLAAIVADAVPDADSCWEGLVFAPEALQAVPYRLERTGSAVTSSLGERLTLDARGLASLRVSDRGVQARRSRAHRPRWPGSATGTPKGRAIAYRPPDGVTVTDGETGGPPPSLGYSLVRPEHGAVSAVGLFIGGSGAHDRHGIARDLDLGYHGLLDRLALRGIASVRFDTRGAGTTKLGPDLLEYGFETRLGDARRCRAVAEQAAEAAPFVLIGHSEGGIAGLALAIERPPAGLVMLATPARPVVDVLRTQIRSSGERLGLDEDAIDARVTAYDELVDAARQVDDDRWIAGNVPDRIVGERGLARYLRDLMSHDVAAAVRQLRCPLLVVHGADDEQVPVEDAHVIERIARGAGVDTRTLIVPETNHLLKSVSAQPGVRDYRDRRRRVRREVVEAIAGWIGKLAR